MSDEEIINQEFRAELPADMEAGAYADFASLWHTQTSFVIDFMATKQPASREKREGAPDVIVQTARVTARVRIPPQQVFELCKALTAQLDLWEIETGQKSPDQGIPGIGE